MPYLNYLLASDELQQRLSDDRSAVRHPVDQPVPWPIIHPETGKPITIRVVDVSPRGIGIFIECRLEVGGRYTMRLDDRDILLEAMHCNSCLGIDTLFRAGLFLRSYDEDLVKIFRKAGLIKT